MTIIDQSIIVNASIEQVFELLDDPARLPDYVPGVRRIEIIQRSDQRTGDSFVAQYSVLGLAMPTTYTTIEYTRPHKITLQMDGSLIGTFTTTLKPEGRGTWVNMRVQYHIKGGILGKAADGLVVERLNEKNVEHFLENLKIISEGSAQ